MDISAPLTKSGHQSGAVTNLPSVRNLKAEACSHLYSLPRRELQALCKQHGIPANKTNVAMADMLCAFTPMDSAKAKAAAGVMPLGVNRTVAMKAKVEKKVEIRETSLASFILSGVVKPSPAKLTGKASAVESDKEIGFPQLKTTPLRRGVKRSTPQTVPEEKLNLPRETRALVTNAVENPSKSQILTPKKRGLEASVVTTRGTRDLPPAFPQIVTPQKAEVQSPKLIILGTTGKSTKGSAKSKRGAKKVQTEEATLPDSFAEDRIASSEIPALDEFSRRLKFADERTDAKANENPEREREVESETEIVEINYAEIEFKDGAVNKETLGVQDSKMTTENDNSAQEVREEATERNRSASQSSSVTEFELKNIASHKELLGLQALEEEKEMGCDSNQVLELAQDMQQRERLETAPETENENMVHADADADTTGEELPVVHDYCGSLKDSAGRRDKVNEDRTLPVVKDVDDWVLQSELPESHEGAESFSEIAGNGDERNDQRLLVPVLPGSEGKAKVGFETFCNEALETGCTSSETGLVGSLSEIRIKSEECKSDTVSPLSKIEVNIDSTLAKAEAFLLKVSAWRAEAKKKTMEGYGDPKGVVIVEAIAEGTLESVNAGDEGEMPKSKQVSDEERSMPSAKKARISLSNEQVSLQEKLLNVCKDEIGASKTEIPINKKVLSSAESMEPSQVSDKENHSDKSMEDTRLKKSDRRGKDRKKGEAGYRLSSLQREALQRMMYSHMQVLQARKYEVLKERSQNVRPLKANDGAFGATKNFDKENSGQTNLQDLSLRKLRAHVKEKDKVDSLKALQPQRGKNMAH